MKNFKLLLVAVVAILSISSCMKNEYVEDNSWAENQARIDSTLEAQKSVLAEYAMENLGDGRQFNDTTGIWFEILETPTEEEAKAFEYSISPQGSFVTPSAKVKYKGQLLNGTVFDEPSIAADFLIRSGSSFQQGVIPAWTIAFYPETVVYNGQTYHTGLVEDGLKKGHKIRFIAPSPYCYDNRSSEKIPADSPLDFTIEVIDIKEAN